MRRVVHSSEVAHLWANQVQEEACNTNQTMFFHGTRIYSYGRHFCMAKLFPDKKIVLINDHIYSNTTSRHQYYVRQALPYGYNYMWVSKPDVSLDHFSDHEKNIEYFIEKMKGAANKHEVARSAKDRYFREFESAKSEFDQYITLFKIRTKISTKHKKWLTAEIGNTLDISIAARKAQKREEERKLKKAMKEYFEKELPAWRDGFRSLFMPSPDGKAYLRRKPLSDRIQTTAGASVAYESAKLLFEIINSGRDIKGHNIDGYTVISMNGDLKIGCHEIPRDEVFGFAKTMGWC